MRDVRASVYPHNHNREFDGPLDVRIGVTRTPSILQNWNEKVRPLIQLEQPDPTTNLTLLRILFLAHGSKPTQCVGVWHQANMWGLKNLVRVEPPEYKDWTPEEQTTFRETWKKMRPSHITIYLKTRFVDSLPHPIPRGKWTGVLEDDIRWALFNLQAVSLGVTKKPEPARTILVPGDPTFDATRNNQIIVS